MSLLISLRISPILMKKIIHLNIKLYEDIELLLLNKLIIYLYIINYTFNQLPNLEQIRTLTDHWPPRILKFSYGKRFVHRENWFIMPTINFCKNDAMKTFNNLNIPFQHKDIFRKKMKWHDIQIRVTKLNYSCSTQKDNSWPKNIMYIKKFKMLWSSSNLFEQHQIIVLVRKISVYIYIYQA